MRSLKRFNKRLTLPIFSPSFPKVAWAKTKFVGCGVKWCDKEFGFSHPWIPGETVVTCDYAPTYVFWSQTETSQSEV